MRRLIDEDTVKRRMHETMDYQDLYLPVHFEMCMKDAPTIDAVEVVRCGECKWSYDAIGGTFCSHGVCVDCVVYDDWFCKDGERKYE